jgi:hypothetical protein
MLRFTVNQHLSDSLSSIQTDTESLREVPSIYTEFQQAATKHVETAQIEQERKKEMEKLKIKEKKLRPSWWEYEYN